MAALAYRSNGYDPHASPVRRGASFALALAIAALILWAFIHMGGHIPLRFGDGRQLATFDVTQRGDTERKATKRTEQKQQQRAEKAATAQAPPRTAPRPPLPPTVFDDALPGVIYMGSADFRRTDIGRIKGTAPARSGEQSASAGESDVAIGTAPNGEPLYAAEWYRKPRPIETEPYMPVGKSGWGMVACKTAPRFHVEDCVELGETPGSGIARGLRQSAWQFLVRPPKKGGEDQIGVWVRIRFDLLPPKGQTDDAGR